ncbi:cell division protein ZapA [Rhodanobacter terrae]|uniref:Cell division protein ZapA n=1 Tax=Rhodanobacter terrae TaxID=418647 RepID=A0ABW0SXR1_9GAMM
MSSSEPVALRLIDREFLIACAPEERDGLLEAAGFLDRKMRELRANAKAPSFERLAVLTAISVTHEFLSLRKQHDGQERRLSDSLAALRSKLDAALESDPLKR